MDFIQIEKVPGVFLNRPRFIGFAKQKGLGRVPQQFLQPGGRSLKAGKNARE
jgi:hypothetical protein